MVVHHQAELGAMIAEHAKTMPRPLPEDFAPELTIEGDTVVAFIRTDGLVCRLGFHLSADPVVNGKAMRALWQSMWQALECRRLSDPAVMPFWTPENG
jgi:hypothetical protein